MLKKPIQERFSNWAEIIKQLNTQNTPNTKIDSIVATAVSARNATDVENQKQENEAKQKAQAKSDFCKIVYSQFNNTILEPLRKFAEHFNSQYAGGDKYSFPTSPHEMELQISYSVRPEISTPNNIWAIESRSRENTERIV
jgi:hypothetical protein